MKIINVNKGEYEKGDYTFSSVQKEILRDEILMISPHNSDTKQFYAGVATIYPNARSRGHAHQNSEELCFITKGKGTVIVGDEEADVQAGDLVYVPKGKFHMFKNSNQTSIDLFFVISPPKPPRQKK